MDQWLLCIGFALALLLVDEVVKFFMRRGRERDTQAEMTIATATPKEVY
jgi:hypothetical protein